MPTIRPIVLLSAALAVATPGPAAPEEKATTWNFDKSPTGAIAEGFTAESGTWAVVTEPGDETNHVLAQQAENPDDLFNVTLARSPSLMNVDLSVRLKAVSGELDRGGGLVWRAKDGQNYYIARYNPLEENFRVYRVAEGRRTQLRSADNVRLDEGWHALRVTMVGPQIRCMLDGRTLLNVEDETFAEAGRIGLWTKADARHSVR